MLKFSKILSVVATVLILTGALFKTSHWPGANMILITGTVAAILLFILLFSFKLNKSENQFSRVNNAIAIIVLIFAYLAALFKFLHWSGAHILIWIADIGLNIAGISFLVDSLLEKEPAKWTGKVSTLFFIILLMLVIFLVA